MIQSAKVTFSKIGVISAKVESSSTGVASHEKRGTIFIPRVVLQNEGFICRIGNKIQLRNIDCEVLGERELTEEEIKDLEQENN